MQRIDGSGNRIFLPGSQELFGAGESFRVFFLLDNVLPSAQVSLENFKFSHQKVGTFSDEY
jgi:hypothetical protein